MSSGRVPAVLHVVGMLGTDHAASPGCACRPTAAFDLCEPRRSVWVHHEPRSLAREVVCARCGQIRRDHELVRTLLGLVCRTGCISPIVRKVRT